MGPRSGGPQARGGAARVRGRGGLGGGEDPKGELEERRGKEGHGLKRRMRAAGGGRSWEENQRWPRRAGPVKRRLRGA